MFPHHKVDEQPNKKPNKGYFHPKKRKRRQECCGYGKKVYHNWVASRKIRMRFFLKEANSPRETRCKLSWDLFERYGSLSTQRQASIREKKGPSLGKVKVKNPHQRSLYAMKFEDLSHEETERQQRCARSKAWNLDQNIFKLKQNDQVTFCSPAEEWVLPAASTKEPEERKFVVDSGASMHMVSKRDFISAELETMRTSRSPTTVMTANGEVQTREQATIHVKQLDLFITVTLLEETPAVLSLGKLCEDHGHTYHWTSGQKPHLIRNGKRIDCNISYYVPFVVPGLSTRSSTTPTRTSSSSSSKDSVFDVNRSGSTGEELREDPVHKPTETENKNKNEGREEVQSDLLHDLPVWQQEFRENLVDESTSTEPWGNPEQETLPSHLVNFLWSREQKWNRVWVSTVSTRTFRRTQIVISA